MKMRSSATWIRLPPAAPLKKGAANAEEALKILETYAPEKTGMLSALEAKKRISLEEYEEGCVRSENRR